MMTLIALRSTNQVFCGMLLCQNCLFFLIIRQGSGVFRRKTTEVKCHFHYTIAFYQYVLSQLLLALVDMVFFRLLYYKVILLPCLSRCIFETKSLCADNPSGNHSYLSPAWVRNVYINSLEFIMRGLSPPFFIYSTIYNSMDS